jgi:hypothetical protein
MVTIDSNQLAEETSEHLAAHVVAEVEDSCEESEDRRFNMIRSDLGEQDESGEEAESEGHCVRDYACEHHEDYVAHSKIVNVDPQDEAQVNESAQHTAELAHLQKRPDLEVLEVLVVEDGAHHETDVRQESQHADGELAKVEHVEREEVVHVSEGRHQQTQQYEVEQSLVYLGSLRCVIDAPSVAGKRSAELTTVA